MQVVCKSCRQPGCKYICQGIKMPDKKTKAHLCHLRNGIPIVLCDSDYQTCRILVNLEFGAQDEEKHEYGATHFIEHLLGQSVTGEKSLGTLKKKIETLGGDIGLYTTYEKIGFFVNTLPEHLIKVISIIAPQIMTPVFDTEIIEQEKNVILQEYRRYTINNHSYLSRQEHLFQDTGLGHCILGAPDIIRTFTAETLSKYYSSHLSNDRCSIVIVGPVLDVDKLLSVLNEHFGSMPCVGYKHKSCSITPTFFHDNIPDLKNIKLTLGFAAEKGVTRRQKIANGVFRKILQDRLIDMLRYKNGFVYSVQCSTLGTNDTRLYTIETEFSPKNIESVISTIVSVCRNILTENPITTAELSTAKNTIRFHNARLIDSIDKRCDLYAQYMLHYRKLYDFDTEAQDLDSLDISDVIAAGRTLLCSGLSVVTQGGAYQFDIIDYWLKNFNV